jgi:hypothetical protein
MPARYAMAEPGRRWQERECGAQAKDHSEDPARARRELVLGIEVAGPRDRDPATLTTPRR